MINFITSLERPDLKVILLQNKIDSSNETEINDFWKQLKEVLVPNFTQTILGISAKEEKNIEILKNELVSYIEELKTSESTIITNQRHQEALQKSLLSVQKVEEAITNRISTELLAYELRAAMEHLGEISGEFTNDEVLGNIFGKFCIGK
ncbi:tRNA modification GTPase [Riemerella anatipestifer]|uniref:hypothetical protein n=1 Tax=Riemerella anatipestifer TaxID=34085 RepID=UPI00293ECB83|nr:hypothetical protein [Riemerella anatipestifer]